MSSGAGRRISTSAGTRSSSHSRSSALEPVLRVFVGGHDDPVELLLLEQPAQRVAVRCGRARCASRPATPAWRRAARSPRAAASPRALARAARRRAAGSAAPARGTPARASRPRPWPGARAASNARREIAGPVNGSRIRRDRLRTVAARAGGRAAAASSRRRRPTRARRPRSTSDHDGAHARSRAPARCARSATIRTSTPGSSSISRCGSGGAQPRQAARGRERAHQDVGASRAARRRSATAPRRRRTPRQHVRAEHRRELAQRAERALAARREQLAGRPTHSRSSSAPSRCAERHARRTSALRAAGRARPAPAAARRPPAGASAAIGLSSRADRLGRQALGSDLLGDLAQRDLAQRGEVLDPEEVVERRVDPLGAGRPCRRAAARSAPRGVRSISTTSSARAEDRVGDRLAHADAGQLGDLVVERSRGAGR